MARLYKLSNGQYAELPDDISDDEAYTRYAALEAQIAKENPQANEEPQDESPEQPTTDESEVENRPLRLIGKRLLEAMAPPKTAAEGRDRFYNMLRNLLAGTRTALGGEEEPMKHAAKRMGGIEGVPEPIDFSKEAGLKPDQVNHLYQAIPGIGLSMLAGNPIQRAAPGAGLLEKGLRLGGRSGIEGIKDALIAAQFNPENPVESAQMAGKYSAAGNAVADLVSSSDPRMRALRGFLPPAAGGTMGYLATRDQPAPVRAAAVLGGMGGGHLAGMALPRAINGPRAFQEPAAGVLNRAMGPAEREALDVAEGAFERSGIPGTLADKSGSAQHREFQRTAAQTPRDVSRVEDFVREQDRAIGREAEGVKRDIDTRTNQRERQLMFRNAFENYDPELATAIGDAYRNTGNQQFRAAEDMLMAVPERAQKYSRLDPNSLEYLYGVHKMAQNRANQIRSYLDNPPPPTPGQQLAFSEEDFADAVRFDRTLVNRLDRTSPTLSNARREAEYHILGREIRHHSPQELLQIFNTPRRMQEFQNHIRDNPELIQRVDDLRTVLNRINRLDPDAMARGLSRVNLLPTSPKEAFGTAKAVVNRTVRAPYSRAAVDLILDPNVGERLHELAQMNNTERFTKALSDILIKSKSQKKAKEALKKGPMLNINIGGKNKPVFTIEEQ